MPYIKVIQPEDAESPLKEIYEQLAESRGKIAEVHKIQSLNPESIVAHMELYLQIMFGKSPLRRYQREMMAVVVSKTNQCSYCIRHHAEALQFFWKEQQLVENFIQDYRQIDLHPKDLLLCRLAQILTENPTSGEHLDLLEALKNQGLEDRGILDATLVISYFNFVNRMVLGLGVELEADGADGYKYE